jgi:hypothetical protein
MTYKEIAGCITGVHTGYCCFSLKSTVGHRGYRQAWENAGIELAERKSSVYESKIEI